MSGSAGSSASVPVSAGREARKLILGGIFALALAVGGGYLAREAMASRADWAPDGFDDWSGAAVVIPVPRGLASANVTGDEREGRAVWGTGEPPFQRLDWSVGYTTGDFEGMVERDLGKVGLAFSQPEYLTVQGGAAKHRFVDQLNLHMTTWRCEASGRAMMLIVRAGPETDPGDVMGWNQRVLGGVHCD